MREPVIATIGLGANLGDARQAVHGAVAAIAALGGCQLLATSPLYEDIGAKMHGVLLRALALAAAACAGSSSALAHMPLWGPCSGERARVLALAADASSMPANRPQADLSMRALLLQAPGCPGAPSTRRRGAPCGPS